jgi:hypothetical protein
LPVVHVCAESLFNGVDIRVKRIGRKLDTIGEPFRKIGHESDGVRLRALADAKARNELRIGVDRYKGPLIANMRPYVSRRDMGLLLADVSPDFIDLEALARQIAHFIAHEPFAAVPDLDHKAHDGVAMRVEHPFSRPDRIALDKGSDDLCPTGERKAVHSAPFVMITSSTRTGSVEEGIAGAAHKIFTGAITTMNDLKTDMRSLLPTDSVFSAAFEGATVSNRKLARYYLRSLEMAAKGESEPWHIPNDDRSTINLEHVLPENPEGNWPQFSDDQVKLYYKRIGNLALMRASDNSDLKSVGFATKKATFAKSPYVLKKQIADANDWTADEISARQKTLATYALKAWPIK